MNKSAMNRSVLKGTGRKMSDQMQGFREHRALGHLNF